jgi:RNA polymerase sigma factor for flagellar operon FliA
MSPRDVLLAEHGPMVEAIARRVRAEYQLDTDLGDLVNDGYTGLLEALDRYNPAENADFGAWAYRRVHGAIVDGIRRMARVSRRAHDRAYRDLAVTRALEAHETETQQQGKVTSDRQGLAGALQGVLSQVAAAFTTAIAAQYEGRADPEQAYMVEEEHAELRSAIESLPVRQKQVVERLFLGGMKQEEVAAELGITRAAVAQASSRGLAALRDKLR